MRYFRFLLAVVVLSGLSFLYGQSYEITEEQLTELETRYENQKTLILDLENQLISANLQLNNLQTQLDTASTLSENLQNQLTELEISSKKSENTQLMTKIKVGCISFSVGLGIGAFCTVLILR